MQSACLMSMNNLKKKNRGRGKLWIMKWGIKEVKTKSNQITAAMWTKSGKRSWRKGRRPSRKIYQDCALHGLLKKIQPETNCFTQLWMIHFLICVDHLNIQLTTTTTNSHRVFIRETRNISDIYWENIFWKWSNNPQDTLHEALRSSWQLFFCIHNEAVVS